VAPLGVLVTIGRRVRGRRPPQRAVYAALLAMGLAWAIHNASGWDWQMPAVTLWFFAVGGLALASPLGRSGESASPSVSPADRPSGASAGTKNAGSGPRCWTALAVGWLVLAIAPLLVGFSYQPLRASGVSFVDGNCAVAKRQALSSISLLAVRPQAYEILGYCDLRQAYPVEGLAAMRKAVSYDANNWNHHHGLAIALAANGLAPGRRPAGPTSSIPRRATPSSSWRSAPARTTRCGGSGWRRG
jgi:hypothetical protein